MGNYGFMLKNTLTKIRLIKQIKIGKGLWNMEVRGTPFFPFSLSQRQVKAGS